MTRTAGAQIGCQRLSRFWGLGCPKIYHEAEDTLEEGACFGKNNGVHSRRSDCHFIPNSIPLRKELEEQSQSVAMGVSAATGFCTGSIQLRRRTAVLRTPGTGPHRC
ncbi:hypothetical protein [Thiolapillus sp.]|uniref:hypothetical protein n=2 Tax=Thiolapillus sp. TaxID=2017437 RepID=UPI0025D0BE4A|nr:hypothetical protein [Thiolapillus sp.]